jgi:hypothetical protein
MRRISRFKASRNLHWEEEADLRMRFMLLLYFFLRSRSKTPPSSREYFGFTFGFCVLFFRMFDARSTSLARSISFCLRLRAAVAFTGFFTTSSPLPRRASA